jgi:hypothetical protein
MEQDHGPRFVVPPEFWEETDARTGREHLRKLAISVGQLLSGGTNSHFAVTLDPGETETEVLYSKAHLRSSVLLSPQTASAASSLASGLVYAVAKKGGAVIHHDSSSVTDRRFAVLFAG